MRILDTSLLYCWHQETFNAERVVPSPKSDCYCCFCMDDDDDVVIKPEYPRIVEKWRKTQPQLCHRKDHKNFATRLSWCGKENFLDVVAS